MQRIAIILFLSVQLVGGHNSVYGQASSTISLDFCGHSLAFDVNRPSLPSIQGPLDSSSITLFCQQLEQAALSSVVQSVLDYKTTYKPDDWLYYQLIRKVAQQLCPKAENYEQYTLYKWWLLSRSGYDMMLTFSKGYLLFYIQSNEDVYDIPVRRQMEKQYVCLNYHDYKNLDLTRHSFTVVPFYTDGADHAFSYKMTSLPEFKAADGIEKEITFRYAENDYHFKIRINPQVQSFFTNYPVVDYASYFNIPLSEDTYQSLIPALKKTLKRMSVKDGVDYLMHFTRYAFSFQPDAQQFGGEKRLTAEQTLFYDGSDCEDRTALLFCLIKEIYNLPMIVLNYPNHVTIAVHFQKPIGKSVMYNGKAYTICEPSSQRQDLALGQMVPSLKQVAYEVGYVYYP